jgi:hypothetical protein
MDPRPRVRALLGILGIISELVAVHGMSVVCLPSLKAFALPVVL